MTARKEVADSLFYFVHMETLQYFKDRPEDLETVGVSVGSRMALRETMKRLPFTDPLEAVKFVCKDIWQALFGKQADRLQMNRRFYVVQDTQFKWLRHRGESHAHLAFPCGILRGLLEALGFPCVVTAEVSGTPPTTCTFTISLQDENQYNI
jgi:hypothetical protein